MSKLNGFVMIPIGLISILALGIFSWGGLNNRVKDLTTDTKEIKETHKEDIKSIDEKLDTIVDIVGKQAVAQSAMQTSMEFMREDLKEIKEKIN